MIVVLDTNVWVSGLQFAKRNSIPTQAIEKAMTQDVIATCAEIEEETYRVLTEKFRWGSVPAQAALDAVLARAIRVQLDGSIKGCRDPKDDIFLECAVRARAHLLIAGDKDLLMLGAFQGTQIITPAAYVSPS